MGYDAKPKRRDDNEDPQLECPYICVEVGAMCDYECHLSPSARVVQTQVSTLNQGIFIRGRDTEHQSVSNTNAIKTQER